MTDTHEVMRAYLDRITAGDFQGAMEFYADDMVAHVGGRNPTSGVYDGKAAFGEYLARATGMVDSISIGEHDLLTSDAHAVVLSTMDAERGGAALSSNRVVVYHVAGGKITELWIIDADQAAVDEFMS